ncbi:MAG: hypothetical protein P8M70_04430 [Verrucomicrobiota bacterium]|nr:hypothetical protein [Verrucomicrobiota bacterium]
MSEQTEKHQANETSNSPVLGKIKMAREVMEALQFLYGENYGREFNNLRRDGMTIKEIHEMLGRQLSGSSNSHKK